jgi:hypothetical protein
MTRGCTRIFLPLTYRFITIPSLDIGSVDSHTICVTSPSCNPNKEHFLFAITESALLLIDETTLDRSGCVQ